MEISDFKKACVYTHKDLISAFGGSFNRPRGITPINSKNVIVLLSYHTGRPGYEDVLFDNDTMIYTGEGQVGDQQLTGRNKSIYKAREEGKTLLMFVIFNKGQYTYFGEVEVIGEPYYANEAGFDGKMRKVIKFKIARKTSVKYLTNDELNKICVGGIVPEEKEVKRVVGAAIYNDVGEILCAQRGYGSLIGKWEFPGGKVKIGETDQQALTREIKEELSIIINVGELVEESTVLVNKYYINLFVYKCKYLSGTIKDDEHKELKWLKPEDLDSLDWAPADIPVVKTILDSLPRKIDGLVQFNYYESEAVKTSDKELNRAVQDYERSQRNKKKSGDMAEEAVIRYERDKLNNAGRPDLADQIRQVSKISSDYGYDILSFEIKNDGSISEIHIEVKSVTKSNKYIEFFISRNELRKFKNNENHRLYCLYKENKKYLLHVVNRDDFFRNKYLYPLTYRVRIRVSE